MSDHPEDQGSGGGADFNADDAKLNKELTRIQRERAGSKGAEYPHDETYAPGYHEGGVRFGFFNGHGDAPKAPAAPTDGGKPKDKA